MTLRDAVRRHGLLAMSASLLVPACLALAACGGGTSASSPSGEVATNPDAGAARGRGDAGAKNTLSNQTAADDAGMDTVTVPENSSSDGTSTSTAGSIGNGTGGGSGTGGASSGGSVASNGFASGTHGRADAGVPAACVDTNAPCTVGGPACCSGVSCFDGVCGMCLSEGDPCSLDGGGVCCDGLACNHGACGTNLCSPDHVACGGAADLPCCNDDCNNATCGG